MGWLDSIFGSNKTSTSEQTGTSSTQNQAWNDPRLQNLFNSLFSQVGQAQTGNTPINQYQTGAADQLAGAGNMVFPAYNAAGNVADTGISVDNINRYMSPYTQNVVNATQNQFDQMNARTLAGQQASRAKAGALTGTQGNVGRAFGEMQLAMAQNPVIAGLYQQGYNSAVDTAGKDAAVRTQAAGTQGNLVNAYTNSGTAAYGAGQNIWDSNFKNTWSPLQYSTQAASSLLSPFLSAAGTTTNSSGTSTGEQTSRDSLWNIGKGVAATGMALFSDERVKHDIKPVGKTFDGMPIYTFKYNGDESGRTHMGLMAQDVEQEKPDAVGSYEGVKTVDYDKATRAHGGAVGGGSKPKEFHEKVTDAFKAITEMKRSTGGPVGADPNWTPVVEKAPETSPWQDWAKDNQSIGYGPKDDGDMLGKQQASLASFMSGLGRANGGYIPKGHADGDAVIAGEGALPSYPGFSYREPDVGGWDGYNSGFISREPLPAATNSTPPASTSTTASAPPKTPRMVAAPQVKPEMMNAYGNNDMPEGGFWGTIFGNTPKNGVLDGKPMSKWDRLTYLVGNASISTDGSGKAGITDALTNLSEDRRKDLEARNKAAELLMKQSAHPYDIAHKQASTNLLNMQADKDYQFELEKRKIEYAKQLAIAQKEAEMDLLIRNAERFGIPIQGGQPGPQSGGNTRFRFVPNAPSAPTGTPPGYAEPRAPEPVVPTPTPPPPKKRNNEPILGNSTDTAHPSRAHAYVGQYYRKPDGTIWKKSLLGESADIKQ